MEKLLLTIFGKKNLKSMISKDWLQKIISVFLAVILWYFVGGEDKIDKIVMVPIEIINLPRDLVISNQFKKEIEVTVSGPRSIILEMVNRAVTRQVDLSAATPGTMVIENDVAHIPVPRNIEVQRIQPSSIILSLDKLIQKQFPVSAQTIGNVANGYVLRDLKIDPDVISITGPQTILSQFDDLSTKPINIENMKQSAQLQVPLDLEPAIVELIGETSVTADLLIELETETKTFEKVPVRAVVDGLTKEVIPPYAKVTVKIPKKFINDKEDLKSLFSLTAIKREGIPGLQIRIIPKADLELPLELVAVSPLVVFPVDEITEDSKQVNEGGSDAEQIKPIPPAKVSDLKKIKQAGQDQESSGKKDDLKHLTSEKTKKILSEQ